MVASPRRAGDEAAARLSAGAFDGDDDLARLHWIVGRSEREEGRLDVSRHHLEEAMLIARDTADTELLIAIHSSLAFTLARQGDLDAAEKLLEAVEPLAEPVERTRLMAQRGVMFYLRGDLARGADVLVAACEEMKRSGDSVHEARHRANLGMVLTDLGRYGAARRHLARSVRLADELGLDAVGANATARLGHVSNLEGDLPGAMREFAESDRRHVRAGADSYLPELHTGHARALADAALLDEAEALLARTLQQYRSIGQLLELPGYLLRAAGVRLATGNLEAARAAAAEAVELFTHQGRERWVVHATNLMLQIRARLEGVSGELVDELHRTADQLDDYGWIGDAIRARLVAARLQVESGVGSAAAPAAPLRRAVRLGRCADRVLLAYIDAAAAVRRGDRGAARRAITRGLRIAVSAQSGLGAIETRAHAARHGYDLSELGARLAIDDRRPRELLARIEATRLMSSRMPMLRPPDDEVMAAMLTELRSLQLRIADASLPANRRIEHEHQRRLVERRVLHHARGVRGDIGTQTPSWEGELDAALALLGRRQLLAYANVDGRLVVVSVRNGTSRIHDLGHATDLGRRLDAVAFALHRLNRTQGSLASRHAADDLLAASALELSAQLLPPDGGPDGDAGVVVIPTARLHDVPWGVLPGLAGRAVSVSPSVSAWAKAEQTRRDRLATHGGRRSAALIAGPGLHHADSELAAVGPLYDRPAVVGRHEATAGRCLELIARADTVHFACHGTFRTDNPMFSSLGLHDGPLVVYDFERLPRFPETMVLSACHAANARVLQGGSLLGLSAALITLGVANVVAPLVPISDQASVAVMTALHRAMVAGASPAEALAMAAAAPDIGRATAGAFVALGA